MEKIENMAAAEKEAILKTLENEKYKLNKQDSIGLSGMMVIIDALVYIISMLEKEPVMDKPTEEAKETVQKPKKEAEKKKRVVDYGKIVALHKAGWPQKKIGEEIGVSGTAISIALKRYKDKMEDGYIWDAELRKFVRKENE